MEFGCDIKYFLLFNGFYEVKINIYCLILIFGEYDVDVNKVYVYK